MSRLMLKMRGTISCNFHRLSTVSRLDQIHTISRRPLTSSVFSFKLEPTHLNNFNLTVLRKEGSISTFFSSSNIRCYSKDVVDNHNDDSHVPQVNQMPTPFQKRVLVMAKMYPSVDEVPDRISRQQMKKAMDMFRVRASMMMAALVFVFAAIMALIGRRQRHDGQTMTKIVLDRREQERGQ